MSLPTKAKERLATTKRWRRKRSPARKCRSASMSVLPRGEPWSGPAISPKATSASTVPIAADRFPDDRIAACPGGGLCADRLGEARADRAAAPGEVDGRPLGVSRRQGGGE